NTGARRPSRPLDAPRAPTTPPLLGAVPGQLRAVPGQLRAVPGQLRAVPGQLGAVPGQLGACRIAARQDCVTRGTPYAARDFSEAPVSSARKVSDDTERWYCCPVVRRPVRAGLRQKG